jgi:predicted transcriptional regulator
METPDLVEVAADVVAAFVANNSLPIAELPALIQAVHGTVVKLARGADIPTIPQAAAKEPMVPIRKSITPDYLICLEDGKKFKSLKKHLAGLGLTPAQYREKWKLPADYPMVAPNYAAQRSALAKKLGLGQLRQKAPPRGRRSKAAKT